MKGANESKTTRLPVEVCRCKLVRACEKARSTRVQLTGASALTYFSCAFLSPSSATAQVQDVLHPAAPDAWYISVLSWWMFAVAGVVLLVVLILLGLAVSRARGRTGQAPLSTRRAWLLVIAGGIAAPLLASVAVTLSGLYIGERTETGPGAGALTVEVTGRLWWWEIRYLDDEGDLIAVTANEMHVPVGQRTEVVLLSDNVIHSFWVPSLQGKTDMVPGRINRTWIEPAEVGVYRGQCAEFCGLQHALMAFAVVAEPEEAFEAWLEHQSQPVDAPERPELVRGQEVFIEVGCGECHAVRGTEADGQLGPDLTHFASRESLAAVTIPNTPGHLAGWITDPQHVKPGALMPAVPIPAGDLQPLLAYLESLE